MNRLDRALYLVERHGATGFLEDISGQIWYLDNLLNVLEEGLPLPEAMDWPETFVLHLNVAGYNLNITF